MKFVRQDSHRFSKIGKNRRKLQKWRKPKGRHSKIRQKRRSYPTSPTVGHKSPKKQEGKIKNLTPIKIENSSQLQKVAEKNIIILSGKLGAKKKIELIKKAAEKNLKILNLKDNKK